MFNKALGEKPKKKKKITEGKGKHALKTCGFKVRRSIIWPQALPQPGVFIRLHSSTEEELYSIKETNTEELRELRSCQEVRDYHHIWTISWCSRSEGTGRMERDELLKTGSGHEGLFFFKRSSQRCEERRRKQQRVCYSQSLRSNKVLRREIRVQN